MKKFVEYGIPVIMAAIILGCCIWIGNLRGQVQELEAVSEAAAMQQENASTSSEGEASSGDSDDEDAAADSQGDTSLPEKHILNPETDTLSGVDHGDSAYYTINDYYNMTSSGSLTIISNFATYQQLESYTCGPSSAYMVLNYFEPETAAKYDELSIAEACGSTGGGVGTSAEQIATFFTDELGWEAEYYMSHDKQFTSCEDFINVLLKWNLELGYPIMVDWSISSGHWEVIIGYDDMGTSDINDDVLIFADPSDCGDHYQDGYMVFNAVRFFRMWKESTPFDGVEVYKQQYVVAHPAGR